jgi:cephalosporin hydroxylase
MDPLTLQWILRSAEQRYTYGFAWLGRPIIQFPQDMMGMQELVWQIQPDAIVETGVAHGGSTVFYASLLHLLGGDRWVLGVDIDIRTHNRQAIESHPMYTHIKLLQGSSIDDDIFAQIRDICSDRQRILVVLDSNHTHSHVLRELQLYSQLVRQGSYLVVMDTIVEDLPAGWFPDRPWDKGNNPKTAVWEFLKSNDRFEIDKEIEGRLQITVAPDGWLRCIKD